SNVSIGTAELYATSTGTDGSASKPDSSSTSSGKSSPLRIEYSRWIVVIVTRATGSMALPPKSCTLYNSVNLRPSSGVVNCCNSSNNVSGRWNQNTRRRRYSGSRRSQKPVSVPVETYTNANGRTSAGTLCGSPSA